MPYPSLAVCAVLGFSLAVTACHSGGTAAGRGSGTASSPAVSPQSHASPSATPVAPAPVPRVVADCSKAPETLRVRPTGIVIACADGGLGFEKLTWARWGTSGATGQGELYENQCQPDCAEGKFATYPVLVALSRVKTSPQGAYFSEVTVTWEGRRPPNSTPHSFPLMPPRTG